MDADRKPSKLLAELQEIMHDLLPDYTTTFLDFDRDTAQVARTVAIQSLQQGRDDVEKGLQAVTAMFLWWFLLGREHALRGYAAPIKHAETTEGLVPDSIAGDWTALEEALGEIGLSIEELEAGFEGDDEKE